MIYRTRIAPEAEVEILKAKHWYEEQLEGLGTDFVKSIKLHIETLKQGAVEHKPVLGDIRRLPVKRFPYVIYYRRIEETATVEILAVLHDRQTNRLL